METGRDATEEKGLEIRGKGRGEVARCVRYEAADSIRCFEGSNEVISRQH